jgi:integrase
MLLDDGRRSPSNAFCSADTSGFSLATIADGAEALAFRPTFVSGLLLNIAASEWMDESGLTWLERPPKIKLLPVTDARKPYPLSWEEQTRLFRELPDHLARMALFKVNTGCREQEACGLRWDGEIDVPELNTSVFLIPAERVKNGEERLVVLNSVARSIVEGQRGQHPEYVFTYCGERQKKMNNSAWRKARARAGLPQVRVHDLKHTFGRRLRAAGVSFEDRQDLLGHKSGRITSHYIRQPSRTGDAKEKGRLMRLQ